MLLQRTRATSVAPVWTEIVTRWPSPASLAAADDDELRRVTSSLGLSWRIRLLREAARAIARSVSGAVPDQEEELRKLPGVGPYAASATVIMAFHGSGLVIDNNVVRVLSRLLGTPGGPEVRRRTWFARSVEPLAPTSRAREVNLALLDLAATTCQPKRPRCHLCPLASRCRYRFVSLDG